MFNNVGDANALAPLSLILWIPVTFGLFFFLRPALATTLSALLAWMLLPERVVFDPPVLPPFDKNAFAFLSSLVACLAACPRRLWRARPRKGLDRVFVLLLLAGAVGTAYTNRDSLQYGSTSLPALTWYDGLSIAVRNTVDILIPFYLGKALIRDKRDLRDLITSLAGAGLFYSLFILIEVRFSPQLNRWVYGFHQHSFDQTLRAGGYRPMVFMSHGLSVALFVVTTLIAAIALAKHRRRVLAVPAAWAAPYLFGILLICKSLGAIIYGVVVAPVVWWLRPRAQILVSFVLCLGVVAYPILKATEVFPSDALVALAEHVSEERAQSLQFRFDNDINLVRKSRERPWFGWGGFARGRIYDKWGRDISVTDGRWIILLNDSGMAGLVAGFGLLIGPVFLARRRLRFVTDGEERALLAALCLIVTVDALDCLPNSINSSFEYFLPGALFGYLQAHARLRLEAQPKPTPAQALAAKPQPKEPSLAPTA
jgi:hypothetical protein